MSPLTESEERMLLAIARQALEAAVRGNPVPSVEAPEGMLGERCGAFVTLRKSKRLRGCIGFVERARPLYRTVQECAGAAAKHDPRFRPVAPEELSDLHIEISVLSPFFDIDPEKVEPGVHGLMITRGPFRGLLLPQVAREWNWDGERFLAETCLKAGLEPDAWRSGARVQAFTAWVFGEVTEPAHSLHHAC